MSLLGGRCGAYQRGAVDEVMLITAPYTHVEGGTVYGVSADDE
jgi:hypothetical protein